MRREVEEETGLIAAIDGPPVIVSDTETSDRPSGAVRFHHVRFIYPMTVIGGVERVEVGGSTDAFAWRPLAELDRADTPDIVRQAVDAIRASPDSGPGPT